MPDVTVPVLYDGPCSAVEGAGFFFPRMEPVEVPSELAVSLTLGSFQYANLDDVPPVPAPPAVGTATVPDEPVVEAPIPPDANPDVEPTADTSTPVEGVN